MSMNRIYFGCALVAVGLIGQAMTGKEKSVQAEIGPVEHNVVTLASGDAAMAAARKSARASFDSFWTKVNGPGAQGLDAVSIKVGIPHSKGSEHIWMSGCDSRDAQRFACTISNDPVDVPLKLGARYSFDREMISDWMYRENGKIHGGYSIRALLPTMPKDQAEALSAMLAPAD